MKQQPITTKEYKKESGTYNRPELTFEDLEPVLSKYGDKINTYKKTQRLIGKGMLSFLYVALRGLSSKYKFVRHGAIILLLVLINGFIQVFDVHPNLIYGIIAFSILLTFIGWALAKRATRSFKIQLIQALFMDNDIAVTVDPSKHIDKEHFNSTNIFEHATLLSGEDCIKGSTTDFHFILSELSAKGKLSWTGFDDVYTGLYFYGTWQNPKSILNFRIQQRGFLDGFVESSDIQFQKHFMLIDADGNEIDNPQLLDSIPRHLKEGFIGLVNKYNYPMEVICHDNQIVVLLQGGRDYFPLNFDDKVSNKTTFQRISKDVFFACDLVRIFDGISG